MSSNKKNVIFLVSVKNEGQSEKYGGFSWMDISRKTWEYWCEKNNCTLFVYDTPVESDLLRYRVTWQRWFDIFDQLEKNNIEYNKVCLMDSTSMVRWDCPLFFDLVDDRMVAWRDMSNLNWIYNSAEGYKPLFNGFNLDISKYINCGSVILNENHKSFLKDVKDFYYQNIETILELQDKKVRAGTDQTVFNYLLQTKNIEVNRSLPISFNLNHLHRGDWLSHNWQLNEDPTPFFIKYSFIWRITGMPKDQRSAMAEDIWRVVGGQYE